MIKKFFIAIFIGALSLGLMSCIFGDDDSDSGTPATAETILGKWLWQTFTSSGSVKMVIPLFGMDTTMNVDTSYTVTDGSYIQFNADSTFESYSDDADPSDPTATQDMVTENGTWWINGALLYMVAPDADTVEMRTNLSGNQCVFYFSEVVNEVDETSSVTGTVNVTVVTNK
ncbi:MAG: hypothetical protein HQK83_01070 [Fibrobacteria bacterium]|nr:hypothetical protein [Fibrobacteria bacterium]